MNKQEVIKEIDKSNLKPETKEFIINALNDGNTKNNKTVVEYLKYLGIGKEILELFDLL